MGMRCLLLFVTGGALWLPVAAQTVAPANDSITKEELEADLRFLASDALRGRLTGTPEYFIAAKFIESRFRRLGLKAIGPDGAFFHRFSLTRATLGSSNRMRVIQGQNVQTEAKLLEDFRPMFFSASGRSRGEVVFAGFGIEAPSLKWDDFRGDVIRGKLLLVLDGEPGADDPKSVFDGVVKSIHADAMRKTLQAQEKGAIGILFVSPGDREGGVSHFQEEARSYWPEKPPRIDRYALGTWAERVRIPAAAISPALAQFLLGDRKLADLAREAEHEGGVTPVPLGSKEVEIELDVRRHVLDDRNVVAAVEGADSQLKQEAVILSAHYDHNGSEGDEVFNGADDNGSGTVALLEIAEAYALAARQGQRPKRSVLFLALGSEERCCGPLLGAWAWSDHPWWPLEKTAAVLNMDMIGRNEEVPEGGGRRFRGLPIQTAESNANSVNIIGYSYSPDLRKAVTEANRSYNLLLRFRYDNNRSELLRRSDHWVFLQHGVPALWFHTGLHPDYHTVGDRPEKANYGKMQRIARLVHQLSWDLAQRNERPAILDPRPIPGPD